MSAFFFDAHLTFGEAALVNTNFYGYIFGQIGHRELVPEYDQTLYGLKKKDLQSLARYRSFQGG